MLNPSKRVAYSPAEFAALFGKSQTWGYRQIYAGKVTTITKHGRILIPAADVERILAEAGIYNGEKKRVAKVVSKAELWKRSLAGKKSARPENGKPKRSAILARLRPPSTNEEDGKKARFKRP
jgi:hypothetical protein